MGIQWFTQGLFFVATFVSVHRYSLRNNPCFLAADRCLYFEKTTIMKNKCLDIKAKAEL